jgi:hypothetical protein
LRVAVDSSGSRFLKCIASEGCCLASLGLFGFISLAKSLHDLGPS